MKLRGNVRSTVRRLAYALCLLMSAPSYAGEGESAPRNDTRFTVAPYGWLAGIDGTLGTGSGDEDGFPPRIDVVVDDELDELGFMFYAEWRGERWLAYFDSVWANVSQDGTLKFGILPDSSVEAVIDGNIYQLSVGYQVLDRESSTLTLLGGARYYDIDGEITTQGGILPEPLTFSSGKEWADAVVGQRGAQEFGNPWHGNPMADFGWGESDQTWQWSLTVGYRYGWGSVVAGYRQLHLDYESGEFKADLTLGGPLIGAAFRF
jgi:hypothetical protein